MPVVPRYDQQQVQQAALPTVRVQQDAPIEAFGGGRAVAGAFEAAQGLTNTAMRIAVDERQKANDVSLGAGLAEAIKAKQRLLHDPENGALSKRGQNAFGLPETVNEQWQKTQEEILANAPNDDVRAALSKHLVNQGLDLNEKIQVHVGRERETYDSAVTQDLVQTSQNDALLNYNNPQRLGENINLMRAAIAKLGMRKGVPVDHIMADEESKVHTGVIEQYINAGQDRQAQAYFDKNRELFGPRIEQATKLLESATMLGESQRASDEILAKTGDLSTAMKMVKERFGEDPKLRQATERLVEQTYNLKERAENERSENQMDSVLKQLETSRGQFSLPNSAYSSMKTKHIQVFEERKRQILSGQDAPPNGPDYYNLRTMASDPVLQSDFKKMNLLEFATKMPATELHSLMEHQANLRAGNGKSDAELGQFRTQNEVINSVLAANRIDGTNPKPGSDDAILVEKLRTQVERDAVQYAKDTNKKPDNAMIQKFAEQHLLKVTTEKDFFWDSKKPRALLDPGETGSVQYKDIPKTEIFKIEQTLKARNKPVTPQDVESIFNQYLNRNR